MRRLFLYGMGWIAVICWIQQMAASPAFPRRVVAKQPNGAVVELLQAGNEALHYFRTSDGVPVVKDGQGYWCYAQWNGMELMATDCLACNEGERTKENGERARRLREAFEELRSEGTIVKQRYGIGTTVNASVKPKGTPVYPVILVEFPDMKFTETCDAAFFQKHFNAEHYTGEGGPGSVRDYFIAQSDSQFCPAFDIVGPVTVSKKLANYGGNSGGKDKADGTLAGEAIDSAVAHGVDFNKYVTEGNKVPFVAIVYAGYGEQVNGEYPNAVWAQYLYTIGHENGGKTFSTALLVNEIADYDDTGAKPDGIGTFCHEFSHAMGLPDFYPTNGLSLFGLDYWDLMDWGQYQDFGHRPVGYSAYERMFMGWLNPVNLGEDKQFVELSPLAGQAGVRSALVPNTYDTSGHEYLLLENRTESPWFSSAYGEGMLVYHIDYNLQAWQDNNVNIDPAHQRITILPADDKLTPSVYNENGVKFYATAEDYQGDVFPGYTSNTTLSATSIPAMTAYTGGTFTQRLTQITRRADGVITFCYQADGILDKPENLAVTEVGDEDATITWSPVAQAEGYCLVLKRDGEVLRCDTLQQTAFQWHSLTPDQSYSAEVYALAADYLDSPVASAVFTTYPLSVHSLPALLSKGAVSVYSMDGQYLGTAQTVAQVMARGGNTGVLLLRQNGKTYKIKTP